MTAVYKVVRVVDGKYLSCSVYDHPKLCLEYRPGRWTKPNFGKILAFESRLDALSFASFRDSVFEAKATRVEPLASLRSIWRASNGRAPSIISFQSFWRHLESETLDKVLHITPAPPGTVACDKLMLVKEIK